MAADSDDDDFLSELLAHGRLQVQQRLFHVADAGNFFMSELLTRAPAPASSHQIVQVGQLGGQDPRDAAAKTFSLGTLTSSKVIPRVSLARWPILISFRPLVTPGESASTIKPVNALPAGHFGSELVLAKTKYQFATPPFVIHIF